MMLRNIEELNEEKPVFQTFFSKNDEMRVGKVNDEWF